MDWFLFDRDLLHERVKSILYTKMWDNSAISRGFLGILFSAGEFRVGAQKDIIVNFFFFQGFFSWTLTTHRTAGEERGPFFSYQTTIFSYKHVWIAL